MHVCQIFIWFFRLSDGQWLNDTCVELYIAYLQQQVSNAYIFPLAFFMLLKTGGPVGAVEKVGPSPALILSTVFILVYEISGYIQVIMLMFPPVNLQCLLYSMNYLKEKR